MSVPREVIPDIVLAKVALAEYLQVPTQVMPDVVDVILIRLALDVYKRGARSIERRMHKRVLLRDQSVAVAEKDTSFDFDNEDTPVMGIRSLKK
jgi:hypothetical protein